MHFKFDPTFWLSLLIIFLCDLKSSLSLNCDKTFTYYEEYGQNSFNVTCNGIIKGYEYILENITINNEISLTISNSILENLTSNIFKNVKNIRILSIFNSTFEFDRRISIFNKLEKLEDLVLQDTRFNIDDITLKGLKTLKTLQLHNNSLSGIEVGGFEGLESLEKLEIVNNRVENLEDLQLCELRKLKTLILRNNYVSNIKLFYFLCRKNGGNLDFDINDMPVLPNIYQTSFFNVTTITHDLIDLDLSHNQILDVGFSLDGLNNLRFLNLGFNKLIMVKFIHFKSLDKLEKFLLTNNQIQSLDLRVFMNKTRLNFVDVSHNRLKDLIVMNMPRLQLINISHNNLTTIQFRNLTSLKQINLEYNKLRDLSTDSFIKVPKLTSLNLAGNNLVLRQGFFQNVQALRSLNLNSNSLTDLPEKVFLGLSSLKSLDLSYNNLVSLNANTFHDLESLEVLNLSSNYIASLSYLAVQPLKNLRSLDLASNKLQYIEYDVILSKLPDLTNINIRSNLLTCDSLSKIILYLKLRHIGYTSSERMDLATMNENVAGIPCIVANKKLIVAAERRSSENSTLVNLGISVLIILVGIITSIVTYKFYIYLKRRKYRADEFELVDE